jgi:hypothetical protein
MHRLALAVLVALASCGPPSAQPAVPAAGQDLKLVFQSGATYQFSLHAVESLAGGTDPTANFDFTAHETAAVQSRASDGVADINLALTDVVVTGGGTSGSTGDATSRSAYDAQVAPDGRILSMDGPPVAAKFPFRTGFDGSLIVAILPDGLVKPGDSWTKTYDQVNPFGASSGTLRIVASSKYLRDESIGGVNAAVIETTSEATIDSTVPILAGSGATPSYPGLPGGVAGFALTGHTSTDVTTWLDPHGNRILKTHITAKTVASIGTVVARGAPTPSVAAISGEADESVDLVLI